METRKSDMVAFRWRKGGREMAVITAVGYLDTSIKMQSPEYLKVRENVQSLVLDACKNAVGHYNEITYGRYSNNAKIVHDKKKMVEFANDVWATYLNDKRIEAMLQSK